MVRMKMGVVADDITGANDIGIMFAKAGYETHVYSIREDGSFGFQPGEREQPDICILDTNSRLDSPELAYEKVFRATRILQSAGCTRFHNKTCSVFRGNIGAEFDAMLDALGQEFAVVVLGFPKNGRRTVNGVHYVHGKLLAESEFAADPAHPMRESNLVEILRKQTSRAVALLDHTIVERGARELRRAIEERRGSCRYLIVDVTGQEALATIAHAVSGLPVLCGSSAIAEELPAAWGTDGARTREQPQLAPGACGVLCAAGSLMPQTSAQIEHLRRAGVPIYELRTTELFDPASRAAVLDEIVDRVSRDIASGEDALVHAARDAAAVEATRRAGAASGLSGTETARTVSSALAETVERVLRCTGADRVVIAGGETSAAVAARLGIDGLRICREIEPGLPSCTTLHPPLRWLVLKSGSFGSAGFLARAIEHLKGDGDAR